MKQQTLTFRDFDNVYFNEQEFSLPEGHTPIKVKYSTVSPGTELFCIHESIQSGNIVEPGYILCGIDDAEQQYFLFPDLTASSACHCNVKAIGPESLLVPLPEGFDAEYAGFLRFINIGMHAFNQLAKLPENVVVIGLGPVGNLAAQTAHLLGCDVVGIDPSENRRNLANECGISRTLTPEQLQDYNRKFDFVIDTVTISSTLASAAKILKDSGECSMIGIIKDGDLKAADILREIWQRKLIFRSGWEMLNPIKKQANSQQISTEENLYRALNWIQATRYTLKPLLTDIIPAEITAIKDAYQKLKNYPDENMCFVIQWH